MPAHSPGIEDVLTVLRRFSLRSAISEMTHAEEGVGPMAPFHKSDDPTC
jgi:hypothetical protein